MGLLDSIVGAVSDAKQDTNASDLGGLLAGLQSQLSGQSGSAGLEDVQKLVTALGGPVKAALQQIEQSPTPESAADIVKEISSVDTAPVNLVENLFGAGGQEKVSNDLSARTGIDASKVMALLPVVLPMIMKLLNSGGAAGQQGAAATASSLVNNPLLKSFLDSDKDGDADLLDAFKLVGTFLSGRK